MTDGNQRPPLRFPPSGETESHVERESVDRTCPSCGSNDVARYPTLRFKGWFEIVRCQECMELLEEDAMMIHGFWRPWTQDMKRR